MKNLKGVLVYWEVSQFSCGKDELATKLKAFGYEDYIPRNDYRTAALRALKTLLKADDSKPFYRKFEKKQQGETEGRVDFDIVIPVEVNGDSRHYDNNLTVHLNKKDGSVTFTPVNHSGGDSFLRLYAETRKMLDSSQFVDIVKSVLRSKCEGIAMRKSGGVYYIPKAFFSELEKLRAVFNLFQANAALFEVPIYDDETTLDAIEVAVNDDILGELEGMLSELKERESGSNPKMQKSWRILENREKDLSALLDRVQTHEEDLRDKADKIRDRAKKLREAVGREISLKDSNDKSFSLRDVLDTL